ncbi:pyridoxal 5'-phosphate synthase glutaminase subunit PdxT [Eggerthellaceae bacterium 24-137]
MKPIIAVLALQGAFIEHEQRLQTLGCATVELRQAADLSQPFDGVVLPGGESTVQAKLLHDLGMFEPLHQRIAEGLPALGTCAGLILLADHFCTLPVTVRRNAYGRQLGSFHAEGHWESDAIPLTFIRAPRIESADPAVEHLVTLDGTPVAVRFHNQIAAAFHPELDNDNRIYEAFLGSVAAFSSGNASS